jgi:hypothetical protein
MVDIAPSILAWLGLPPEPAFAGRAIDPTTLGTTSSEPTVAYATLRLDDASIDSARSGPYKYILDRRHATQHWYDLQADPTEQHPTPAAPSDAPPLDVVVNDRARAGSSGLKILVTHDASESHIVAGRLRWSGSAEAEIRYPVEHVRMTQDPDAIAFEVRLQEAGDSPVPSAQWRRAFEKDPVLRMLIHASPEGVMTEPDHFLLTVPIAEPDSISLTMTIDGEPVSSDAVHLPAGGGEELLDVRFDVSALTAGPAHFEPAALPHQFGVYIWYVPRQSPIPDSALDAETRAALEALGYLRDGENP